MPAENRIDFVSIVTPNHMHFPVAKAAVEAGFHVICDKPLTLTLAEAEALAKKAAQLSPDNPVVRQLLSQSRMIRRLDTQKSLAGDKEDGFIEAMVDVDRSSTPFVGPIEFPATKDWEDLTKNRNRLEGEGRGRASPAEAAIHKRYRLYFERGLYPRMTV